MDKAAVLDVMIKKKFFSGGGGGGDFCVSISLWTSTIMGNLEHFSFDCINCPHSNKTYVDDFIREVVEIMYVSRYLWTGMNQGRRVEVVVDSLMYFTFTLRHWGELALCVTFARSVSFRFYDQNFVFFSFTLHMRCRLCPTYPTCFDHFDNIWW